METLRILLVSDWFLPRTGGVETAIYNLAKALSEKGHEPIVLTHQNSALPNPPALDYSYGFPVIRLRVPLRGDDYTTSYKAAFKLYDFIKHNAPDVIHGHSLVSPFAVLAIHGGKGLLGIPTVLTHHSLIAEELNLIRSILARVALSRVDIPTGVSTVVKRDLEKILSRKKEVLVTPNCINLTEWKKEGAPPDDAFIITYVSRLTGRKNPMLAVKAFEYVLKVNRNAYLYIAGPGPLKDDIQSYILEKGLNEKVKLLGALSREEVRKLLSSSHLFLMPGKKEAFSIASLEALSLGVPVIGFRGTGLEDMVFDGLNGFLAVDEKDFIDKTVRVASDEDMRSAMSLNAIEIAKTFDCSKVLDKYLDAYRKALDNCTNEKRVWLYRIYRLVRMDPVKPGEWCSERKWKYNKMPPKRSCIPYLRRRT